jgi:SIR2-like domain
MPTHDPRREVEKLREHLASHDKPLALLIGAGASCSVRDPKDNPLIPGIAELAKQCSDAVEALGTEHTTAYAAHTAGLKLTLERAPTIEDIFSSIRSKITVMATGDQLLGATREQLEDIERALRLTITKAADPDDSLIPERRPHHSLARWISRIDRKVAVELFTTNYDTLIERALEDERVAIFDGFVGSRQPFFSAVSLMHADAAPGRRWTRLWKIHGSVNWRRVRASAGSSERIVRETDNGAGELIFPSMHKYDESRKQPYVAILEHLGRVLGRREETVLLTVGYSFGDQHINGVLFDALDVRERTHIISLQFEELAEDHELIKRAKGRHNLLVYGPETAVVGGVRGPWRLLEPVDARTADLLDVPFDSDAEPDAEAVSTTRRFRLGDFAWLAEFLDTVVGADA